MKDGGAAHRAARKSKLLGSSGGTFHVKSTSTNFTDFIAENYAR